MKYLRKRDLLSLFIFGISVLMIFFVAKNIYFDSSFYSFLDETSPSMIAGKKVSETFGDGTTVMVLFDLEGKDESRELKGIFNFIQDVEKLDFVLDTSSIFDAQKSEGFSIFPPSISVKPYVVSENGNFTLDRTILSDDLYTDSLISKDGKTITVQVRKDASVKVEAIDLSQRLKNAITDNSELKYNLIGEDIVDAELFNSIKVLTFVYPPLILAAILAIFLVKFRSFYLSFLTLIPPVISSIWIYFLLLFFGKNINSLTVMIPTFIIIIGSAYGMHYLSRFVEIKRDDENLKDTLKKTGKEEKTPIYFSAFTTMAGFTSYIFLKMEAFRDMGIFVSIGIFLCAFFTMNLIPTLLMLYKKGKHFQTKNHQIHHFPKPLKIAFVVFTLFAMVLSPFFIANLPLNIDSYDYFKNDSEIIRSAEYIKEKFGWISNFYLMIERKDGERFSLNPEEAKEFETFYSEVIDIEQVTKGMSIVSLSNSLKVPLSVLVGLMGSTEQGREMGKTFLTGDSTRFMLFLDSNDSETAQKVINSINSIIENHPAFKEKYNILVSGTSLVWTDLSQMVVTNQIQSLIISFILIVALLIIIFRRIRTALLSIIPIAVTVVFNFIFMTIFGIPLEVPTALISGMLMGLVIDYAIHYMYWFKKLGTVEDAFRMTSSPIIFNGLSLIGCFAVLLTAPMLLYAKMAILMVFGISVGVMSTLVFLPAMLSILSKRKRSIKISEGVKK